MVLYSQGFRLNIADKKITQTGALYFKVVPKNAQVYIDEKLKTKTDLFFSSAFLEGLLPKNYNIKVKKDGYFTWEKNLEVKEREATDAKNIILMKNNLPFSPMLSNIDQMFFSQDGKQIFLLEGGNLWELKLYDIKNNTKSHIIKSTDISKKGSELIDLIISPDNKKIILKTTIQGKIGYYLISLEKSPAELTQLNFLNKDVSLIKFNLEEKQKILFLNQGKINEADLSSQKTVELSRDVTISFEAISNAIYYLGTDGYVYKSENNLSTKNKINEKPIPIEENLSYEIMVVKDLVFLRVGEKLYLFNPNSKDFELLLDKYSQIKLSPDSEKIVYASNFEIWILFISEQQSQPHRENGERMFLTRFSEKIEDIFWLSSHYLIFKVGNKIKVAEIDNRDQINIVDLTEIDNAKIYFNDSNKKLYILNNNELSYSDALW